MILSPFSIGFRNYNPFGEEIKAIVPDTYVIGVPPARKARCYEKRIEVASRMMISGSKFKKSFTCDKMNGFTHESDLRV